MTHDFEIPFTYAMVEMTQAAMEIKRLNAQGVTLVTDVVPDGNPEPHFYDLDILYTLPNAMARKCPCGRDYHRGDN